MGFLSNVVVTCEHIIAWAGAEDRRIHLNPVPALKHPKEFEKKELFVQFKSCTTQPIFSIWFVSEMGL